MDRVTESYPLTWPDDYARTPPALRITGRFTTTLSKARNGILKPLQLMAIDAETGICSRCIRPSSKRRTASFGARGG